ncbi:TonB-dependent receptor plug domain-containing protein [Roseateles sp. MS654]|uniref:TonB-dependent receptor plug domain-containing protein n=1 Tax=Roseateles sp. MS654 TaxID=3412685 RepID=UPI003C2DA540
MSILENDSSESRKKRLISLLAVAALHKFAFAQSLPAVTVQGQSDSHQRTEANGSILRISRGELEKFGNVDAVRALERIPGVQSYRTSNGALAFQVRGFTGRQVQILVDGKLPPPGFSVDTVALAEIEAIELSTIAGADITTGASGAVINIITKKRIGQPIKYKLSAAARDSKPSLHLAANSPLLNVGAFRGNADLNGTIDQRTNEATLRAEPGASPEYPTYKNTKREEKIFDRILNSKVAFEYGSADISLLSLEGAVRGRWRNSEQFLRPEMTQNIAAWEQSFIQKVKSITGSAAATYTKIIDGEGKLISSYRYTDLTFNSDAQFATIAPSSFNSYRASEVAHAGTLRYLLPSSIMEGVSVGADYELRTRTEAESSETAPGEGELSVIRKSAYLTRDWKPRVSTALSAGVRLDAISGCRLAAHGRKACVLPAATVFLTEQMTPASTLKLGVGKSNAIVDVRSAIAVRQRSAWNSLSEPDSIGNPNLLPEKVVTLDASLLHKMSKATELAISATLKQIDDPTVSSVFLDTGRWTAQRVNEQRLLVANMSSGIKSSIDTELFGKTRLAYRLNVGRSHSRFQGSRTDVRIENQTPWTLDAAVDVNNSSNQLAGGLNVSIRSGANYTTTDGRNFSVKPIRKMDVFISRNFGKEKITFQLAEIYNSGYEQSVSIVAPRDTRFSMSGKEPISVRITYDGSF